MYVCTPAPPPAQTATPTPKNHRTSPPRIPLESKRHREQSWSAPTRGFGGGTLPLTSNGNRTTKRSTPRRETPNRRKAPMTYRSPLCKMCAIGSKVRIWMSILPMCLFIGCAVTMSDAKGKPRGEVAIIRCYDAVKIMAVDGKPVRSVATVIVSPGEHSVEAGFSVLYYLASKTDPAGFWPGPSVVRFTARAGQKYRASWDTGVFKIVEVDRWPSARL